MNILPRFLYRLLLAPVCAFVIVLGLTHVQHVNAQTPVGQGAIEGRAVVVSAGSNTPLNNLPVSLFTFIGGVRQVPPAVSQTDAQGRVRFEQLNTTANYTYTMFIKFQDNIYGSGVISFTAGSLVAQAPVKVYDITSDVRALRAEQHHVVIDIDEATQSLAVVEFYALTNNGDRTIVGSADPDASGKRVSFRVPLPPDAVIESVEQRKPGEDVFQVSNQLLDTVPIPPGSSAFAFSYRLPYQRSTLALAMGTPITTAALNLLVAPAIKVRSTRLALQDNVTAGSRQYQLYSARDLPLGASIAIELSGLPAPLIPFDVVQWLPLTVASFALIATLYIASRKKKDVAPRRQTPA